MTHTRSRFAVLLTALAIAVAPLAHRAVAQTSAATTPSVAPTLAYDVITIKPNNTNSGSVVVNSHLDHYSATNVSLPMLLQSIFGIDQHMISGIPPQLMSARFDIEAKIVEPDMVALQKMTHDQERVMLLPLLTEHFHLKSHLETKTLPVYDLVLAKGGPKFQRSATQGKDGNTSTNGSRAGTSLTATNMTMQALAKGLAEVVQRNVVDKTGLTGDFDLKLRWSRGESNSADSESSPDAAPEIFTALQEQLGLKLEPGKGPVDTLVVDHVERPSEN